MPVPCTLCNKELSCLRSLRRHKMLLHNIQPEFPPIECSACGYRCHRILQMNQHARRMHGGEVVNQCSYCALVFVSKEAFQHHLNHTHGLPIWHQFAAETELPTENAIRGALQVFTIPGNGHIDVLAFMNSVRDRVDSITQHKVTECPQKLQFSLTVTLEKPDGDEMKRVTIFANSPMQVILGTELSEDQYFDAIEHILNVVGMYASSGSGWIVERIEKLELRFARFNPIRGSSFLKLPSALNALRCLLNIRNYDDANCFKYCYTAAYHLQGKGTDLVNHEDVHTRATNPATYSPANPYAHQPIGQYEMPMSIDNIKSFEVQNDVSINIFRYEKKSLYPFRISKFKSDFIVDMLLLSNGQRYHYVLIKNLTQLIKKVQGKNLSTRARVCRNCFHVCCNEDSLKRHQELCLQFESCHVTLPKIEDCALEFKRLQAKSPLPLVLYFDLESIILPIDTVEQSSSISSTRLLEKHVPSGFCFVGVAHGQTNLEYFKLQRSEDCIAIFVQEMEKLAREIFERKQRYRIFQGEPETKRDEATTCWICEKVFVDDNDKCLDHCHYSNKFLGWAHSRCNLMRKTQSYTPVVAHNLSGYDLHHIIQNIHHGNFRNKVSIVPQTDEKYISLSLKVWIKDVQTKKGKPLPIYEELRFIDSFRFMSSSLEKLVSGLPMDCFAMLDQHFSQFPKDELLLLHGKGFYPYSYMDSFEKFKLKNLPERRFWTNSLQSGQIGISNEDYELAQILFERFQCKSMGDYHDLYLAVDTLQLACWFEQLRNVCLRAYELDCAQYLSAPHLAGDAFMKICRPDLELLSDRSHLDYAEALMRGGMSSVYAKRIFTPNNKYLDTFDDNEPSTYGFTIDANNLYGGIMKDYCLPMHSFTTESDISIGEILDTADDAPFGYIVNVDLLYPDAMHDDHQDFPLAPSKEIVDKDWLSDYQQELLAEYSLPSNDKNRKLLQTLYDKRNYTVHYITLKVYVRNGMKVDKLNSVLKFKQSKWMAPYVNLNTSWRQNASTKTAKDFFKLMNNSAFGKCCESMRSRLNANIVRNEEELLESTDKFNMKSFKIINQNLAVICMRKTKILWQKPTIVGATILDLSKAFMFQYHYEHMKKWFNCTLLYSDTDSLTYAIKTEDLYKDLQKPHIKEHFDFSNYPHASPLFDNTNHMVTLKFKDELAGKVMQEFVGLKPKMYSILAVVIQKFVGLKPIMYSTLAAG